MFVENRGRKTKTITRALVFNFLRRFNCLLAYLTTPSS
jgi:hypothetical protein